MQEKSIDHSDFSHVCSDSNGERPGSESLPYSVTYLARVRQELLGQTSGIDQRLCEEVAFLTRQRVRLILHRSSQNAHHFIRPSTITFPVEYENRSYGLLACQQSSVDDDSPQVLMELTKIAGICGWVLWELERTALIESMGPQEKPLRMVALSKRQREILELLGRGYDDEAMEQKLDIEGTTVRRHRQHLYKKLGVCCESDAILAAYRLHLSSPLENISPQPVQHPV